MKPVSTLARPATTFPCAQARCPTHSRGAAVSAAPVRKFFLARYWQTFVQIAFTNPSSCRCPANPVERGANPATAVSRLFHTSDAGGSHEAQFLGYQEFSLLQIHLHPDWLD